jgi:hypothetical protein
MAGAARVSRGARGRAQPVCVSEIETGPDDHAAPQGERTSARLARARACGQSSVTRELT